jgi:hypothetical protein
VPVTSDDRPKWIFNRQEMSQMKHDQSKVQGEGDYASAKKYNEETESFAHSGKVEKAAKDAAPRNAQEQEDMRKAESEGRSHAKEAKAKGSKDQSSAEADARKSPGRKP